MGKPIDTEFFVPRLSVSLVVISGGGVEFVRAALEAMNCVVHVHFIGTPMDFLKVIAQSENAPRYMVIMGHGDENGLIFGDYGVTNFDTSMLHKGSLPPEVIQSYVRLPDCTVFSYSCAGGSDLMARAFLTGGLAGYIGCRTEVTTSAMTLFLFHFFYCIQEKRLSDRDAWHRAVAVVDHDEVDQFSYFHGDGMEERFTERSSLLRPYFGDTYG